MTVMMAAVAGYGNDNDDDNNNITNNKSISKKLEMEDLTLLWAPVL